MCDVRERRGASPSGKKCEITRPHFPSLSRERDAAVTFPFSGSHPSVPPFVPSVNLFSPNPIMWVGASLYYVHAEGGKGSKDTPDLRTNKLCRQKPKNLVDVIYESPVHSSIWQQIFFFFFILLIFEWPFGAVDPLPTRTCRLSHAIRITLLTLNLTSN